MERGKEGVDGDEGRRGVANNGGACISKLLGLAIHAGRLLWLDHW